MIKENSINFVVNQEKGIDTIFKNLSDSNSMSIEMRNSVKPVGTRPGIMYWNYKVHKQQVDSWPPHFGQFYQRHRLLHIALLSS